MNKVSPKKSHVLRLARSLFYLLSILFLLYGIVNLKDDVVVDSDDWINLFTVFAFYCATALTSPLCSFLINRCSGSYISYAVFFRANITSLPSKYIPGGIWQSVGRAEQLSRQPTTSMRWVVTLLAIENIFSLCLGGTLALFFYGLSVKSVVAVAISILLLPLLVLVIDPVGRKLFLPKHSWKFTAAKSFLVILAYIMSWLTLATSFFFYTLTLDGLESVGILYVYMSYFSSWLTGFIAFFAPQGIGVFEGIAATLLLPNLPVAQAASLIFGYRLLVCVSDLTLWGSYYLVVNVKKLSPS